MERATAEPAKSVEQARSASRFMGAWRGLAAERAACAHRDAGKEAEGSEVSGTTGVLAGGSFLFILILAGAP